MGHPACRVQAWDMGLLTLLLPSCHSVRVSAIRLEAMFPRWGHDHAPWTWETCGDLDMDKTSSAGDTFIQFYNFFHIKEYPHVRLCITKVLL